MQRLRLKESKTRIVELRPEGEGFTFLGFDHRLATRTRRDKQIEFLIRFPSPEAMHRARQRVREVTARRRLLVPVEQIVQELNVFLRGWSGTSDTETPTRRSTASWSTPATGSACWKPSATSAGALTPAGSWLRGCTDAWA